MGDPSWDSAQSHWSNVFSSLIHLETLPEHRLKLLDQREKRGGRLLEPKSSGKIQAKSKNSQEEV